MRQAKLYALTYEELRDIIHYFTYLPPQSTDTVVLISAENVTKGAKVNDESSDSNTDPSEGEKLG